MIVFPHCKINLGLNILRKREDGFHDLETVFYPLPWTDALEIIRDPNDSGTVTFSASGLVIDGKEEDNLCVRAWHLLKKDFPQLPAIKLHLHKDIPMGAGLGGGSSDGAFTLKLLNEKFELNIPDPVLINYAASLGSDGPFFIQDKPCFATGRGEILEPVEADLSAYHILMVNPGIHVNTGWAFSQLSPALPTKKISTIIRQPMETWKQELVNDFEGPVVHQYPAIGRIKSSLYKMGALYAAMSGSGSTVYGIFDQEIPVTPFTDPGYFVKKINPSVH